MSLTIINIHMGYTVTENEERMWQFMKDRADGDPSRTVQISEVAVNSLAVHRKRATDIVKKWDSRGLVTSYNNGTEARLSSTGLETESLEQAVAVERSARRLSREPLKTRVPEVGRYRHPQALDPGTRLLPRP